MTLVVDASVVVSALVDDGPVGRWAEGIVFSGGLAAPHLMPAEVGNVLRRAVIAGDLSDEIASMAARDLVQLDVELFPYEPLSGRVWELRRHLTIYDAWYVALAEALEAELATLDLRICRSGISRCGFSVPPPHLLR
jgi:predicted nucleic acid-binding protein